MTDSNPPAAPRRTSRADQRRQTENRILTAARELFADLGYDRTTIRAVAARAGVDAGLVMHYFRSKDELFARAAKLAADDLPVAGSSPAEVADGLLASLARRLDTEPVASLAVLRSILTHAEAAEGFRAAGRERVGQISAAIPAGDAELRAGLISAIISGVVAERYLLRTSLLVEASPEEIVDLLRPCFQALVGPPPTAET